jgi:putative hydrolase of the HAD superfamily
VIKAVFFDFGGVLLQFPDGIDHAAIETRLGVERGTLFKCLYRDSLYADYQVGKCSEQEWIDSIRKAAIERVGAEKAREILQAYEQAERPLNPDMMRLVRSLLDNGYRTGIISNTIPGFEDRLLGAYPEFRDLFEIRVGSGDLGIAKPDPGIFHHALDSLGVAPEAAVFTDDVRSYAEAAGSLGMHGFHFTGFEQFRSDLVSLGLPV